MSFFDVGQSRSARHSLDTVRMWANEIAAGYLNSGIAPTDSLVKIASAEELRPHQVQLLAGESNKLIHQLKFASAKEKYMAADFPLADSKVALERLSAAPTVKVASEVARSWMPDPVVTKPAVCGFDAWGVRPEVMDKTASVKADLRYAREKTAHLKEMIDERAFKEGMLAKQAETSFIKEARQQILQNTSSERERLQLIGVIDHFVKAADMADLGRPALAKVAHVLHAEGLLSKKAADEAVSYLLSKEAGAPVPEALISPTLKAKVVNGDHPLYITLKTFKRHVPRMFYERNRSSVTDDHIEILGEKIKAL